MRITVTSGTGEGPTPIAAFDAALLDAGVLNYNLIHLSSVIPPNSTVERAVYAAPAGEYGHRLYVVMARNDQTAEGVEAWAGLGWVQEREDGRGLFVECTGASDAAVRRDVAATLDAMMERRHRLYGPIDCETAGRRCKGWPTCAVVIGIYRSEGWE